MSIHFIKFGEEFKKRIAEVEEEFKKRIAEVEEEFKKRIAEVEEEKMKFEKRVAEVEEEKMKNVWKCFEDEKMKFEKRIVNVEEEFLKTFIKGKTRKMGKKSRWRSDGSLLGKVILQCFEKEVESILKKAGKISLD